MFALRELLAANDAFYLAFERADADAMDAVWADSPEDVCIHPGWELVRGAINVRNTWRRLFASGERLRFKLSDVHAEVHGEVGVVHLVENIWAGDPPQLVGRAVATNLFRKVDGAWKMALHHGSPTGGPPEGVMVRPGEDYN